jgi:hypothetical protein
LSGREGFGFLASSVGFSAFWEIKRLFSTTLDTKKRRRTEVTEVTGR